MESHTVGTLSCNVHLDGLNEDEVYSEQSNRNKALLITLVRTVRQLMRLRSKESENRVQAGATEG